MTADARRHHPAVEETPKISATGAPASPNLADRYGRSPRPRRTVPTRLWVALAVVVTLLAGARVLGSGGCRRTPQRPRHGVHAGESR